MSLANRTAEQQREWRAANPERNLEHQRRYYLRKKYGITLEQYAEKLSEQGGRCAICTTDEPKPWPYFVVDHDHETGCVRGLLCHACNVGIGQLQDDVALLRNAITYLEEATCPF